MPPVRAGEGGFTLIELLVTVAILGVAFATFVGGMGVSILASDFHRKQSTSQTVLRNFAEAIKAATYVGCATPVSYPYPKTRKVSDGAINSTTTLTSATAAFTTSDIGKPVDVQLTGGVAGVPSGAVITGVTNATTVTISIAATSTGTGTLTIGDGVSRTVTDAVLNGTRTITSSAASFTARDVGKLVAGNGIPSSPVTTITGVTNATIATLSVAATTTASNVTVNIGDAAVTGVTYWTGTTFSSSCPTPDGGLELIALSAMAATTGKTETVQIVKRRP